MGNYTYENKDSKLQYEKYEWDNLWLEYANDANMKRVLYIGDSISCRAGRAATLLSNEKLLFDGFGTSKGLDNPYYKDSIRLFAKEEGRRDAVVFNNGLHGWHLDDETDYKYYYDKMVEFLLDEFKNTPVIILLTTITSNEERNKRIEVRNIAAKETAAKYGLPVIDLFAPSMQSRHLLSDDGVHFTPEGDIVLAGKIVEGIQRIVPDIKL